MATDQQHADLLAVLQRDAARELEQIEADCHRRLEEIAEQSKALREVHREAVAREGQRRLDAERQARLGHEQVRQRRERQQQQARWLERVRQEARRRLERLLEGSSRKAVLEALLREALEQAGPAAETVEVTQEDVPWARRWIEKAGGSVAVQAAQADPGTVRVLADGGRRRIDNSLSRRLDRLIGLTAHEIAALLFAPVEEGTSRSHE